MCGVCKLCKKSLFYDINPNNGVNCPLELPKLFEIKNRTQRFNTNLSDRSDKKSFCLDQNQLKLTAHFLTLHKLKLSLHNQEVGQNNSVKNKLYPLS